MMSGQVANWEHGLSRRGTAFLVLSIGVFLWAIGYAVHFYTLGLGRPQPTIACRESFIDLGEVQSTDVIPREFVIQNRGQRPLILSRVASGCSACIRVTYFTTTPIPPSQAGLVRVALIGERINSPQVKGVTIQSNDPRQPQFTLRLAVKPSAQKLSENSSLSALQIRHP